jgi:AraC-like DNA-binding protein
MKRVSIQWVKAIIHAAEACGADRHALLSEAQMEAQTLEGNVGFISLEQTVALWQSAERLTGDPYLGIKMGQGVRPGYLSIVAYTMMSCETFVEALQKVQRYQRLVSEGGRIQLRQQKSQTAILYLPQEDGTSFSRHQIEAVLVLIIGFARWLISDTLAPLEVRFVHKAPDETKIHQDVFRCPIHFGCSENAIILDEKWMTMELPAADPELLRMHMAQADQRLSLMDSKSTSERIRIILEATGHFEWSREHMASRLQMSSRTLQRYLAKEGTTFQQLFDSYRHRSALTLLQDPELSSSEVGSVLGFSEPSTFYRAFKRWEGQTPGKYRQSKNAR